MIQFLEYEIVDLVCDGDAYVSVRAPSYLVECDECDWNFRLVNFAFVGPADSDPAVYTVLCPKCQHSMTLPPPPEKVEGEDGHTD